MASVCCTDKRQIWFCFVLIYILKRSLILRPRLNCELGKVEDKWSWQCQFYSILIQIHYLEEFVSLGWVHYWKCIVTPNLFNSSHNRPWIKLRYRTEDRIGRGRIDCCMKLKCLTGSIHNFNIRMHALSSECFLKLALHLIINIKPKCFLVPQQ